MASLNDEMTALREAWRDLWFLIGRDTGMIRLVRRLGYDVRPWVREREEKDVRR